MKGMFYINFTGNFQGYRRELNIDGSFICVYQIDHSGIQYTTDTVTAKTDIKSNTNPISFTAGTIITLYISLQDSTNTLMLLTNEIINTNISITNPCISLSTSTLDATKTYFSRTLNGCNKVGQYKLTITFQIAQQLCKCN